MCLLCMSSSYANASPNLSVAGTQSGLQVQHPDRSLRKAMSFMNVLQKDTESPLNCREDHQFLRALSTPVDEIEDTDPVRIDQLWKEVMAPKEATYSRSTKSSRAREDAYLNKTGLSTEDTEPDGSRTGTSTTLPTSSSGKRSMKNATVRDPDFEETQLTPRGIDIHRTGDLGLGSAGGAHAYFNSTIPPDPALSPTFTGILLRRVLPEETNGT